MPTETAVCTKCQNVNKVLIATGHSNPANKGKKYFTCASCQQFQWVGYEVKETKTPPPSETESESKEQREPVDTSTVAPSVWDMKDRTFMYQTCLNCASQIVAAYLARPDAVLDLTVAEAKVKMIAHNFYLDLIDHREDKAAPF